MTINKMGESEKPFACPSPGCNMSFTNEDHLMVHKKKHDMILNLGSGKSGVFVADQTPTPTRFIRNCEEVGLFQDLQNVNPFEETFRRAVETGKLGSIPESSIGMIDDTLHTPHIFPHIDDNHTSSSKITCQAIGEAKTEVLNVERKPNIKRKKNLTSTRQITKTTETIFIQEADTSMSPQIISPSCLSSNVEEMKSVQLLLNFESRQPKAQTFIIETDVPLKNTEGVQSKEEMPSKMSLAKARLRQVLSKNGTSVDTDDSEQSENDSLRRIESSKEGREKPSDVRKKQEILARNRASSMRARAKRKAWIQQLQKSMNNVNDVNTALQAEVKELRSEVAKLKTLLLTHKDCPVTKSMEKDNEFILDTVKMIPVTSQVIHDAISINSTPGQAIKRSIITNQIPVNVKRKASTVSASQPSIILPKVDKSVPVVRNPCATLKFVEIGQITTEKRLGKQILIVQNPSPKKVQAISSRQMIQVDQSLQLINVASKSTGT